MNGVLAVQLITADKFPEEFFPVQLEKIQHYRL
jgi:hypothetical protein